MNGHPAPAAWTWAIVRVVPRSTSATMSGAGTVIGTGRALSDVVYDGRWVQVSVRPYIAYELVGRMLYAGS
jgi:hypothetical protein